MAPNPNPKPDPNPDPNPEPNQGVLLLATLVGALLMRGARKLEELAPARRGYSLSVKVCQVDALVEGPEGRGGREAKEGMLKRSLSDIFLARKSFTNKDGAPLGLSLISAVTTSFLGCIAPLATEFDRCARMRTRAHACMHTDHAYVPCVHAMHVLSSTSVHALRPTPLRPPHIHVLLVRLPAAHPPHTSHPCAHPPPAAASLLTTDWRRAIAAPKS